MIVELKQWETVDATAMDGVVRSVVGGGPRELTHPSYQAWSYSCLLEDFNAAVQEHGIAINPCAYLHNCSDGSGVLADCYQDYLERAPVFLRHHTDELVGFLTRCLQQGDGGETIKRIRDGRARPSRQLAEAAALGQKGLSINNPDQNHVLQHYCGGTTVSALQVVCILYVGMQLLLPGHDAGIDFAREYELAKGMAGRGGEEK